MRRRRGHHNVRQRMVLRLAGPFELDELARARSKRILVEVAGHHAGSVGTTFDRSSAAVAAAASSVARANAFFAASTSALVELGDAATFARSFFACAAASCAAALSPLHTVTMTLSGVSRILYQKG